MTCVIKLRIFVFRTFDDLKLELNSIGLNEYNIIIGVDFTASNEWKGKQSKSLFLFINKNIFLN